MHGYVLGGHRAQLQGVLVPGYVSSDGDVVPEEGLHSVPLVQYLIHPSPFPGD